MKRTQFLAFVCLLAVLIVIGLQVAQAQGPVQITLYVDEDSLTIYVPGSGENVSLQGLAFRTTAGQRELESYLAFQGMDFSRLQTPICFRMIRQDSDAVPPIACQQIPLFVQELSDGDVFWYNKTTHLFRTIILMSGTNVEVGTCPPGQPECGLTYIPPPPTPTPLISDTPTETLIPTSTPHPPRVLFILDESAMMATPFAPGQTRWQTALDEIAAQLPGYQDWDAGILVYGPPQSFFDGSPVNTPESNCDDFEWRAYYQMPAGIVLDAIGLGSNHTPGGAIALREAVEDGAWWGGDPEPEAVVIFFGGLAPNDREIGCDLSFEELPGVLNTLNRQLEGRDIDLYLVGLAPNINIPPLPTFENVQVFTIGSPEQMPTLNAIGAAIQSEQATENPDMPTRMPTLPPDLATPLPTPTRPERNVAAPDSIPPTPVRPGPPTTPTQTLATITVETTGAPSLTPTHTPVDSGTTPSVTTGAPQPVVPSPTATSVTPPTPTLPFTVVMTPASTDVVMPTEHHYSPPLYGIVTTEVARVRARPSTDDQSSAVVGRLSFRDVVLVSAEATNNEGERWYFVGHGWVRSDLILLVESPEDVPNIPQMLTALPSPTPTTPTPTAPPPGISTTSTSGGSSPASPTLTPGPGTTLPPSDGDGDGILDVNDACPDQGNELGYGVDANGCPNPPDRDWDGVPDSIDQCPDQPRYAGEPNGCPGGGGNGSGNGNISIRITNIGDYNPGSGCDANLIVSISNAPNGYATGEIHVRNAYYGPEGDVWDTRDFWPDSSHTIHLGGNQPEYWEHEIWITSNLGESEHLGGVHCNNLP